MQKIYPFIAFAGTLLAIASLPAVGQSAPEQMEQTHFSAEDERVDHPVAIPAEMLAILAKDETVNRVLEDQNISPANLPASWFSAAQVQLGGIGEKDFIVAAKGPLVGANVSPFWVFIHDSHGYKLALSTSVHDLIMKKTRSHGYRDLELDAMTASTVTTAQFRFNGNEYKEFAEKTAEIK
jgi:hypothetical protein